MTQSLEDIKFEVSLMEMLPGGTLTRPPGRW